MAKKTKSSKNFRKARKHMRVIINNESMSVVKRMAELNDISLWALQYIDILERKDKKL